MHSIFPAQNIARLAHVGQAAVDAASVAGLHQWHKIDQLSLSNDDPITTWTAAPGVGSAKDFTQSSSSVKPTYKTNVQNGKPAAYFDGGDAMASSASVDLSGTNAITFFLVFRPTVLSGTNILLELSANYNSSQGGFVAYIASNNLTGGHHGDIDYADFTHNTTLAINTTYLASVVLDKSLGTNEPTVWINGASSGSRSHNGNNTNAFDSATLYLGARNQNAVFYTGYIMEFALYSSALGTTDRQTVETYLNSKWAIY